MGRRQRAVLLLLWAALPQLVPFAISQFAVPIYITRATIVTLPVLYLLAAAFLVRLAGRCCFALVSLAALGSLGAQAVYFQGPTKEQWREAAGTLDTRAQPGDVVLFDAGYGRRGFDYYSHAPALRKIGLADDLTSPAGPRSWPSCPPTPGGSGWCASSARRDASEWSRRSRRASARPDSPPTRGSSSSCSNAPASWTW